ncbi:hypothetical protein [Labilibaculum sp.]|uniref:hypothetical protein n=1 Tax=Labilibaculum sp. TaxID=2060723 RepID=UPI002AA6C59D|nr:hypothetical protein [Labilibaculum sp.]MBN2597084.1 hypothetical protein [Marinifilaceae bacterium]
MKKKKFIKPDNLGKTEKKIVYVFLFIMLLIGYFFVDYIVSTKKEKNFLLATDSKIVTCQVTRHWHTHLSGNIFEYTVSGKSYKTHNQNTIRFKKGEYFKGIYAKSKPEIIQIDLTSPILSDTKYFKETLGKIQKTDANSEPNSVLFTYQFLGENYKRELYVENANIYAKGKSYPILVNEKNPMISYLKREIE